MLTEHGCNGLTVLLMKVWSSVLGVLSGQAQPDPDRLNKLEPDQSPESRIGSVSGTKSRIGL